VTANRGAPNHILGKRRFKRCDLGRLVEAGEVAAALLFALLQLVLDQREDDHQGGEEADHAEAEEGDRLVGDGAGEADSLAGQRRGSENQHQGPDRKKGCGGALHGRKSSAPGGVAAQAPLFPQFREAPAVSCENPVNAGGSRSSTAYTLSIRIAVIDTDSGFVTVFARRAEAAGWHLNHSTGPVPPRDLVAMKLNALLIDPVVLGDEAWDYLDRVASVLPDLGLVVCTGRSTVAQRVRGLRLGVDDWMTKPCHPEEALARLEAVSRRRRRGRHEFEAAPLAAGEIEIRPDRFQAFVGDEPVDLTRREFELLYLLAEERGQVLEREQIYQRVWGYAMAHGDRSVDVFIRKLRKKLEGHSPRWTYIHTHFGIGYRFDPEPAGIVEEELRPAEPETQPGSEAGSGTSSQTVHSAFTAG
jgi:DNA-binding response OmpR family regulator